MDVFQRILTALLCATLLAAADNSCKFAVVVGPPSTSAGDGQAATDAWLFDPMAVAFNVQDDLYIADTRNDRIRRVSGGVITTVAGNGTKGAAGDGGEALSASLSGPEGVVVSADGVLYISDTGNHRIRKVTSDGVIQAFAGTGHPGFDGDGGAAVLAELNRPTGLALGPEGSVYVADTGNHRIRRIDADGTIHTVAGSGQEINFKMDCCLSGDGGPATDAKLFKPRGLAVGEDGSLYIADTGNNVVRRVARDGVISTIAGKYPGRGAVHTYPAPATSAGLFEPYNVVLLADGSLLIPGRRLLQLTPDFGTVQYYAGAGAGSAAAADSNGDVFTASRDNVVWRVDGVSREASVFAGSFHAGAGSEGDLAAGPVLNTPGGMAVGANGSLYVADTGNKRVVRVSPDGIIHPLADIDDPQFVAVDVSGNVYVSDVVHRAIRKITPSGEVSTFAGGGFGPLPGSSKEVAATSVQLNSPHSLVVHPNGALYAFVINPGVYPSNGAVVRISKDGRLRTVWRFSGQFSRLTIHRGLALDAAGNILVPSDPLGNGVFLLRADADGNPLSSIGGSPELPKSVSVAGVAAGPSGKVFLVDWSNRIKQFSAGAFPTVFNRDLTEFLGYDASGARNFTPYPSMSLATDAQGNLFIADRFLHRIRKLDAGSCAPTATPVILAAVSSADLTERTLTPGALISIFGGSMGPAEGAGAVLDESGRVATALAGARVLFDGVPGPVLYAQGNQVNAIVPFTMYGRDGLRLEVEWKGVKSDAFPVRVAESAPVVFSTFKPPDQRPYPIIVNKDGSLNSAEHRAPAGSIVVVYATGLGRTVPAGVDGQIAGAPLRTPKLPIRVSYQDQELDVLYAGDAPGIVAGVSQINFRTPKTDYSTVQVTLQAGDAKTSINLWSTSINLWSK